MENFSPVSAFLGGAMVGLSAFLLMLLNGRIAGIAGIIIGIVSPRRLDLLWRVLFIAGLAGGALLYQFIAGTPLDVTAEDSVGLLIAGGFLVGLGSRLGAGCTSGHSVCGVARFSRRSLVATLVFTTTAMLTVFLNRHVLGV